MRKSIIVIGLFVLLISFSFSNAFAWWWGGIRDICEFPGLDDAYMHLDLRFNEPGVLHPEPGGGVKLIITFFPVDFEQLEEIRNSIKLVRFKNDSGISINLKNNHGWFVDEEDPYIEIYTLLGRSADLLGTWKYVIYANRGIFISSPMTLTEDILAQSWPNPINDFHQEHLPLPSDYILVKARPTEGPVHHWRLRIFDVDGASLYNVERFPSDETPEGYLEWEVPAEYSGWQARFETRANPPDGLEWPTGCSGGSPIMRAIYNFMLLEEPSPPPP